MAKAKKTKAAFEEKGNPNFNLKDAKPVPNWQDIVAGPTAEDLAFEASIQNESAEHIPQLSDPDEYQPVKKVNEPYTLLSEFVENFTPAKSLAELDKHVELCKRVYECDSTYATPAMVQYFDKKNFPPKVGYIIYKDIKVYMEGFFEQSKVRDKQTIEQRLFGGSKVT